VERSFYAGSICIIVEGTAFSARHSGVRRWFCGLSSGTVHAECRGARDGANEQCRQGCSCSKVCRQQKERTAALCVVVLLIRYPLAGCARPWVAPPSFSVAASQRLIQRSRRDGSFPDGRIVDSLCTRSRSDNPTTDVNETARALHPSLPYRNGTPPRGNFIKSPILAYGIQSHQLSNSIPSPAPASS
jgi:hypothetical protein